MAYVLECRDPRGSWPLSPGTYLLGRDPAASIRLSAPSVSRRHAEITVEPGAVTLRDLGSRNGTWVNTLRLDGQAPLRAGDRIRLGEVDLLLRSSAQEDGTGQSAGRTEAVSGGPAPVGGKVGDSDACLRALSGSGERGDLPAAGLVEAWPEPSDSLQQEESLRTSARIPWSGGTMAAPDVSSPARKLLKVVTDAGHLLAGSHPLEEVFSHVLDLVEQVVPARRVVLLLGDSLEDEPSIRAARPALHAGEKILLSRTLVRTVLTGGDSLLVTDAQTDARFRSQDSIVAQEIRAALVAPLRDGDSILGLIYVDSSDPRVMYDQDQLEMLTHLARIVGVKISTARLEEEARERLRLQQELSAAARIQSSLLPSRLPEVPGYALSARQIPCLSVAGDLYDADLTESGWLHFALGDVTGKGMGPALLMSHVMAGLRMLREDPAPLAGQTERLNLQLARATDPMHFVTLFHARLDPASHRLDYVNAGHNPPFLVSADGTVEELGSGGLPVGMLEATRYEGRSVTLPPGSLLCVFSDGVTEAARGEEFFGEERLLEILRKNLALPLDDLVQEIFQSVSLYLDGEPAGDDVTLLLLRREG